MTPPGKLRLGRAPGGSPFYLDLDIATNALAIHGVRGKGKTNTAGVMVERLLDAGVQVVIIDPTAAWWGLRSSADGKGEGYSVVILGGEHGDLPLHETNGRVIADFVVETRASVILSLRHLRKNAQRRFVQEFAEQLYHRKGEPEHRTALFLVIDEASLYIPQKHGGDLAGLVGAIEDIVRRGRNAGLGIALVDQRPASVNKEALSQIEVLICHGVTGTHDRKALRDWVEGRDSDDHLEEFEAGLATLKTGEAWVWHPVGHVFEKVQVDARRTFDSSKTPKLGEAAAAPKKAAKVDLDALRKSLDATIVQSTANDPKALKARIAQLERELAAKPLAVDGEVLQAAAQQGAKAERERIAKGLGASREKALRALTALTEWVEETSRAAANGGEPVPVSFPLLKVETTMGVGPGRPVKKATLGPVRLEPSGNVSKYGATILDTLATFENLGVREVDYRLVGAFADKSTTSSTWQENVAKLKRDGLIVHERGCFALTPAGQKEAVYGSVSFTTAKELHEAWMRRLPRGPAKLLGVVLDYHPKALTREALAREAGVSANSSTFEGNISTLRRLGLVVVWNGEIKAKEDLLFPRGLR